MVQRLALALGMALLPLVAAAAPSPSPAPPAESAHDGGTINGRISSVDYQGSTLAVDSPARGGRIDIVVMPSTSIQAAGAGYHSITDLKAGQSVSIFSSYANGKYVAQIIRIR
jgi:hypothetical protein